MERVLGSRPVNGFWSSGLQCSGFLEANQCQLMSPLKAHFGSSPAELQPFAWLSHHLRQEKNGLQLLMSSLVLLNSKHQALKTSLAARRSLAHESWAAVQESVSHTSWAPQGPWWICQSNIWPCPNSGQCSITPALPRFPAQVWAQLPLTRVGMSQGS